MTATTLMCSKNQEIDLNIKKMKNTNSIGSKLLDQFRWDFTSNTLLFSLSHDDSLVLLLLSKVAASSSSSGGWLMGFGTLHHKGADA